MKAPRIRWGYNMKFTTGLLTLALLLCPWAARAQEEKGGSVEENAVQTMLLVCVGSLSQGQDPAALAQQMQYPELPPERVTAFDSHGGHVFRSPRFPEKMLLLIKSDGSCSVAVRDFDTTQMIKYIETYFGVRSKFKKISETNLDDGVELGFETQLSADKKGDMMVSLTDKPIPGRLQGMLSFRTR